MLPGKSVDPQYYFLICLIISWFYDGVLIVLIDFRLFVWFILGIYCRLSFMHLRLRVVDVQAYCSVFSKLLLMQVELGLLQWGSKAALRLAVFFCIRRADWERFWLLGTCRQLAVAASYQRTSHAKNTLRMTSFCAPTVAPFLQPSALLHLESKVTLLQARRSHAPPLQLNAPVGKWQPEVTVMLLCSVLSNSITLVEMPAWNNRKNIQAVYYIFLVQSLPFPLWLWSGLLLTHSH